MSGKSPKGNRIIFFIKDPNDCVWGLALTKLEARQQMAWFLPRGIKYHIEPGVCPRDNETQRTGNE